MAIFVLITLIIDLLWLTNIDLCFIVNIIDFIITTFTYFFPDISVIKKINFVIIYSISLVMSTKCTWDVFALFFLQTISILRIIALLLNVIIIIIFFTIAAASGFCANAILVNAIIDRFIKKF